MAAGVLELALEACADARHLLFFEQRKEVHILRVDRADHLDARLELPIDRGLNQPMSVSIAR
jgi:hypothetical protein